MSYYLPCKTRSRNVTNITGVNMGKDTVAQEPKVEADTRCHPHLPLLAPHAANSQSRATSPPMPARSIGRVESALAK
ncbi:hypothetical protein IAQ61_000486 [Plenodomus lingam]|uniref:uncharacterized protein n=1 Tax=Leptosphaeria maculans TaxID=5022 RepID=UPI003332E016|nr:hypothetical protein IAQ61_000486 [Plenodomus lingam]